MNSFKRITLSRKDLQSALDSFDGDLIPMGVEFDSINGDQILWVDNGKFGEERKVAILNRPHNNEEIYNK